MKKFFLISGILFYSLSHGLSFAEWQSIEGKPVKWGDIMRVQLKDLHPTQPALGYDRIFYKMGRYADDPRKLFDDACSTNGQRGVRQFSYDSKLNNPDSFACLDLPGTDRDQMKTLVIGPDDKLYLTDGHHTFAAFWLLKDGGPDLFVNIKVTRDYRDLESMEEFWKQMEGEKNMWLFDENDTAVTIQALPDSLDIAKFGDNQFRSLMYFTRSIAWGKPTDMSVPDAKFYGDEYSDTPFVEFYWARELRPMVDLKKFNLSARKGYRAAITAVGQAIIKARSKDVGGSGKNDLEMGRYSAFNQRELYRISRPGTGKIDYMLKFKKSPAGQALMKESGT